MQSNPQDEQPKLPTSRDGEPQEPVGHDASVPPQEPPPDTPLPQVAPRSATPPRMPTPPQSPAEGQPPSAWGSPTATGPSASPRTSPDGGVSASARGADEAATSVGADDQAQEPGGDGPTDAQDEVATAAPALGVVRPTTRSGVAPVVKGDWLASVCPYLISEDGTYRSAAPDEGHRCTAQEPAATLPLAFQERYCLTDRHPRCEMYKFAQERDGGGTAPAAVVPPSEPPAAKTRLASAGGPSRPLLATLAGIGGVIVVVLLVIIFAGSCGNGSTDPDVVPEGQASAAPGATPTPVPTPTPEPAGDATPQPDVSAGDTVRILYEIQPDEALRKISETFGITRNRIRRENPELEDVASTEMPGMIIELPIVGQMTLAEAEALPGYVGLVSELEAEAEAAS